MEKVSIITVNYNQTEVTLDLLKSIGEYDERELEVIVVDNGSKVNPVSVINKEYPKVKTIRSEENLGFAGGNNLGMKQASGEYFFLVNNDTILPIKTVSKLKAILKDNRDLAVACPLIYYYESPDTIQYAGFTAINPLTGRNKAVHFKDQIKKSNKVVNTEYAHGAAMMIKRDIVNEYGMMSENYFLYYEELDWIHRIKSHGYRVAVDYSSHILHKESISTGKTSSLKTYFQTRNRILFMRKNFSGLQKLLFFLFFTFLTIPKNIVKCISSKNENHLISFLNGIKWNLTNSTESNRLGYKFNHLKTA